MKGAIAIPPHKSISNGWLFAGASGANAATLDGMFADDRPSLRFGLSPEDLLGLSILVQNLTSMKVSAGYLVGQ